ncbi:hypothetical protein [Sphingosinicella terrae]|uniref:hypothetical protein n=1 Tax=Sphingosinicella terrae TaxID=2172047 RepID=UPI000E0D6B5A|nr:hypothetical protein [Sphingosinicella terrae]
MFFQRLAMFVASGIMASGCANPEFPSTPLFEGLVEAGYERGENLLRERIEQRYKVGDSEAGLEDYLRSQGLETTRMEQSGAPGLPIYGESHVTTDGICGHIVHVNWRADEARIIRELVIDYSDQGCL